MSSFARGFAVASLGLGLGLALTYAALSTPWPIGIESIGPWRLEPRAGAADADPYTSARTQRLGEIALGLGEGAQLTAWVDSAGRTLDAACVYKLGPHAPIARYWTLEVIDSLGLPIDNPTGRNVLRSTEILREPDGAFTLWLSRDAHAGNWLPLGAPTRFGLALRLYDPALGDVSLGFERATAPLIERGACG